MKPKKRNVYEIDVYRDDPEFYFRVGMRYISKKQFTNALKYLEKAVKLEPFEADYKFNYACVLSELKETDKSNKVLTDILINIDPTIRECYFGMGCNYFDSGNLKKAKECFEKYVYIDPEGQFIEEAYDILSYLQMYDDVGLSTRKSKIVTRLVSEAKKLIDEENYEAACSKLEKAVEHEPELISPRIELSLAYFYKNNLDKAISLARSVLKLEPSNIRALRNLAVFFTSTRENALYKQQLNILSKVEIRTKTQLMDLLFTYALLSEHSRLVKVLTKHIKYDKNAVLLQMLAIAYYNLKQHDKAEEIWSSMEKLFPEHEEIINCCMNINFEVKNGLREYEELQYTERLPPFPESEEEAAWDTALAVNTPKIKVKSKKSKEIWKKEWEAIIDCAVENREFIYRQTYRSELRDIFMNFVTRIRPENVPVVTKREAWAAALEYIYCNLHLIRVSKAKLAKKYKVSLSLITKVIEDLVK
ncbi:MAG: tetratricopeptide repeat protein [Clostridia bacterium]|nr:tetratricopeptide repeat protein [Clostridia bacterium]